MKTSAPPTYLTAVILLGPRLGPCLPSTRAVRRGDLASCPETFQTPVRRLIGCSSALVLLDKRLTLGVSPLKKTRMLIHEVISASSMCSFGIIHAAAHAVDRLALSSTRSIDNVGGCLGARYSPVSYPEYFEANKHMVTLALILVVVLLI